MFRLNVEELEFHVPVSSGSFCKAFQVKVSSEGLVVKLGFHQKKGLVLRLLHCSFYFRAASHLGRMTQEPIKDGEGNIVGSKLVIQGAEVENTGSYECTATNTHGKAASLAQLTVEAVEVGPGFGSG